ncbi:MAG: N-acyl homoserine lactonase family protein [Bacteroidota bacterium]
MTQTFHTEPRYQTQSLQLSPALKIHAISTGTVSVRQAFKQKKGPGLLSKLSMFSGSFTPDLPINVYVIEHPEGVIVIDTGENAQVNAEENLAQASWFQKQFQNKVVQFKVERDEEIGPQLDQLGIARERVRWVVLTHLHIDHTDGLHHFPKQQILVHRQEWERPFGDTPYLYPSWFQPSLFDLDAPGPAPFERVHYLTQARDVMMISLPGHTYGQVGVLLKAEGQYYLFAGDVSYDQAQLKAGKLSAAHVDYRAASNSMEQVKAFAKRYPTIYLPAHDPLAGQRLAQQQTL